MTQSHNREEWTFKLESITRALLDEIVSDAIRRQGFVKTLKSLNKGRLPSADLMTVQEGVVEQTASGLYNAALQTDRGRVVLQSAQRTDRGSTDPQLITSNVIQDEDAKPKWTSDTLLRTLSDSGAKVSSELVCAIEFAAFDPVQTKRLLPLLWQYIVDLRDSNTRDELIAVGAATRKYIALMPMEQIGELAVLLEPGHRSPLPTEFEIEIAKMVLRNFEVYAPALADPFPELGQRLWELVQAYINPRVLLRDKNAAATSLAIEAIVSMRSSLSDQALQAALTCPYRWFGELVMDELDELASKWDAKDPQAADWLRQLLANALAHV